MDKIRSLFQASIDTKIRLLEDESILSSIQQSAEYLIKLYQSGGKLFLCGNGGSASDAQHIAAELTGRFNYDRDPLNAEALSTNISHLTAVANDYSFEEVYARMLKAKADKGDILIAISTSGNSRNIVRTVEEAKQKGMLCIGMTGEGGGALADLCDLMIRVPSTNTARIQETHICIGHILCELVESTLFPQ